MYPPTQHPIAMLAGMHLRASEATHMPDIVPGVLHDALARYGIGLDHPSGESPLAYYRYDFGSRGESMGAIASYLITDRRLIGRCRATNIPDTAYDLPFAHVTGVRFEGGLLTEALYVQLGAMQVKLPLWAKSLNAFFLGLGSMPPAHRMFGPPAAPTRADHDPTGASAASQQLVARDPRPVTWLRLVYERARAGLVATDEGISLVDRVQLFDRALRLGRGMSQGFWLSMLPAEAMSGALAAMFGPAINQWQDRGVLLTDFHPPRGNTSSNGGAIASSVVGLAMLATVGVGWVSLPGLATPNLRLIRTIVTPMPCGTGVQLLGSDGGPFRALSMFNAELVNALLRGMARIESRLLLAQCALGSAGPPEQLIATPPETLHHAVAQALGAPLDLRPLLAPQDP